MWTECGNKLSTLSSFWSGDEVNNSHYREGLMLMFLPAGRACSWQLRQSFSLQVYTVWDSHNLVGSAIYRQEHQAISSSCYLLIFQVGSLIISRHWLVLIYSGLSLQRSSIPPAQLVKSGLALSCEIDLWNCPAFFCCVLHTSLSIAVEIFPNGSDCCVSQADESSCCTTQLRWSPNAAVHPASLASDLRVYLRLPTRWRRRRVSSPVIPRVLVATNYCRYRVLTDATCACMFVWLYITYFLLT